MTDAEIKQYLDENNWEVNANDCIVKVLNLSKQIISTDYNVENEAMTIVTPDNVFTFKWVLEKLDIGGYNHDYTA